MNITLKAMLLAQQACDLDELLHRIIFRANDARRKKEPLDIVALVEIERQANHFCRAEPCALDVARSAIDAEAAVVNAKVGEQYLEQRNAPAVGGITMANPHAFG